MEETKQKSMRPERSGYVITTDPCHQVAKIAIKYIIKIKNSVAREVRRRRFFIGFWEYKAKNKKLIYLT